MSRPVPVFLLFIGQLIIDHVACWRWRWPAGPRTKSNKKAMVSLLREVLAPKDSRAGLSIVVGLRGISFRDGYGSRYLYTASGIRFLVCSTTLGLLQFGVALYASTMSFTRPISADHGHSVHVFSCLITQSQFKEQRIGKLETRVSSAATKFWALDIG